jgi:hypothetical protein
MPKWRNGRREMGSCSVVMIARGKVSGRRDSNPRLSAWEADVLPLNYSRMSAVMAIGIKVLW